MIIDPAALTSRERYQWIISTVIPRPIAFVATLSPDGVPNLAPFSYFNAISATPPILAIAVGSRRGMKKDTVTNLEANGELTICLVTEDLARPMVLTSGDWPAGRSEFEIAGLTPVPSDLVRPPRVAESPVAFECKVHQIVPVGETHLVLAEVLRLYVDDRTLTEGLPDARKLRPLARLGGDWYARLGELIEISRPKV
jgi:flavin reductase (DIM6/NTAB) family NADH-FMN oxidoreductase RutF